MCDFLLFASGLSVYRPHSVARFFELSNQSFVATEVHRIEGDEGFAVFEIRLQAFDPLGVAFDEHLVIGVGYNCLIIRRINLKRDVVQASIQIHFAYRSLLSDFFFGVFDDVE